MAVAWARLSSHGIAAPPPLHEACRRQSKGRRTCESLIAQRAGQGKQKVGQTRAEGAWDSDVSPQPPPRDRSRWLRVGATPPTDSCLEQPGIMPFLPPVIVDGHAYCREPSRPAYTPHEFRILVGCSHAIRNQFFEHMNAGKLPKNQEGFSAAQTVRENGHYFERMCRTRSNQRLVFAPTLSRRAHFGRVLSAHVTGATGSSPVNSVRDGGPRAVAVADLCAARGGLSLQEITYGAA